MLRKFSTNRTITQNIQLGGITAFAAGMVNVASVTAFFAFTSNVTGHFAIFAEEIAKGHWHQAGVVAAWLMLFFLGGFVSNALVIRAGSISSYVSHSIPLLIEIACLLGVGIYGHYFYKETLTETEIMVGLLLLAMGLQNGLTASISNSAVKTTHLTGLTTDLSIALSMYTKKKFRKNQDLIDKIKLLYAILISYVCGGIISGVLFLQFDFRVFYAICLVLTIVLIYDAYSIIRIKSISSNQSLINKNQ